MCQVQEFVKCLTKKPMEVSSLGKHGQASTDAKGKIPEGSLILGICIFENGILDNPLEQSLHSFRRCTLLTRSSQLQEIGCWALASVERGLATPDGRRSSLGVLRRL